MKPQRRVRRSSRAKTSTNKTAQRALTIGRMIPGFVHQFRTPLHVIASSAEILGQERDLPESFKQQVDLIRRSAERLQTAVSNLLTYAKGDEPPSVEGSLNEPLNRVIDFLKDECKKRGIQLDIAQDAKLPPVHMQSLLLEEAFLNMAMNGLEAMQPGGTLSLASQAMPETKSVKIVIKDTGAGMDKRTLAGLGKTYATSKKGGVGLGVHFATQILKAHKATVRYSSRAGEGTTATLTFPIATTLAPAQRRGFLASLLRLFGK